MTSKNSGYTLIEILVVLLVVSIVSGVALLSFSENKSRKLENFVNELTQSITLAEEKAMLEPSVLGLSLKEQSFQFFRFKQPAWRPSEDQLLKQHHIPSGIEVKLASHHTHSPQIVITTNGEVTPFTIYVGQKGKAPRYKIVGNADGSVTQQLLT